MKLAMIRGSQESPALYGQKTVESKTVFRRDDERDPFGVAHSKEIVLCASEDAEKWSVWEYWSSSGRSRGNPWKRKSTTDLSLDAALKRFQTLIDE